jgi:hypothetical protein
MVRDSIHNIERDAHSAARSAAATAGHSAATAQAARSAAAGAWAGAGFQAVSALQSARAARAAEEQLEVQRAMAEQAEVQQFAMWRQTPDGQAFVTWRDQAIHLAQAIRDRQAQWLQGWAVAIGQAQAEIPEPEKRRFARQPGRLNRKGLLVAAIVVLVAAALAGAKALIDTLIAAAADATPAPFSYEECLAELAKPDNFLFTASSCEALKPAVASQGALIAFAILLTLGVAVVVTRALLRRSARRDIRVPAEAEARTARYLFDPLAVRPGYQRFTWDTDGHAQHYADQIMHLALTGHRTYPGPKQLPALQFPAARDPHPQFPEPVNDLLAQYQQ